MANEDATLIALRALLGLPDTATLADVLDVIQELKRKDPQPTPAEAALAKRLGVSTSFVTSRRF